MQNSLHNNELADAFGILKESMLIISGGALAAQMPFWLNYALGNFQVKFRKIVVTPAASRFVTIEALQHMAIDGVFQDDWTSDQAPNHVKILDGISQIVVYPATLKLLADYTNRACSTPVQLAINSCDQHDVYLFSSITPDSETSSSYQYFYKELNSRPNFHVFKPVIGSALVGDRNGLPAMFFPRAILEVSKERSHESKMVEHCSHRLKRT